MYTRYLMFLVQCIPNGWLEKRLFWVELISSPSLIPAVPLYSGKDRLDFA
jgi:hypothetical protein